MAESLLYGAYGYTGELIARRAAALGLRPVLAGRRLAPLGRLAGELGLASRVFPLDDPAAVRAGLAGITVVLHCAGPFSRTAAPMVEACLERGAHYLDITGEIDVFEGCAGRDGRARAAGVTLLPGVGFDVVPSDCLAAHLKRRLPGATRLALGFQAFGRPSRGTMATMIEKLDRGSVVRENGALVPIPAGSRTRTIDFGRGPRPATAIPWGDVSTAYHSTGIPNVEVYLATSRQTGRALGVARRLGPVLSLRPVKAFLTAVARGGPPGPAAEERARGLALLWGEATDGTRTVVSRMRTPDGYELTARTAVLCLQRVLAGGAPPGFQTPSRAFGADFVLEVEGVTRTDD